MKYVYFFSSDQVDGRSDMKDILGGKGANLAEMCSLGIAVPPGFTISTQICKEFYKNDQKLSEQIKQEIETQLTQVEKKLGKKFGDESNPLLLSVRSGARVSMPGMMDTILNLGLNDKTVRGLEEKSGNPRFAWDSYRRFIQMYSHVVMGMNASFLEVALEDYKDKKKIINDADLSSEDMQVLVKKFKDQILQFTGQVFPEDPKEQLWEAISAVFCSWNTSRAQTYRELQQIPEEWGTAVNVQAMVFGNRGDDSATGVAFTRNPSTGEKKFFGEFLVNAQGEDVVAGIRTPQAITKEDSQEEGRSLEELMPQAYKELVRIYEKLEKHYRDMQDIEFTIEQGKLWMLQTRSGKRTAKAAIRIACDMIDEGLINEKEALQRIEPESLEQLLHRTLDPQAERTLLAKGLPASPGAASGQVVFTPEEAVELKKKDIQTILVRLETSPEDIEGMVASQGILTTRGGMTSHAAVVARGMGKCCIAGCGSVQIEESQGEMRVSGYVIRRGDQVTLDGATGEVFLGEIETVEPQLDAYFTRIMKVADNFRKLKVRANADTPGDAHTARRFGAEGIGLCRTEHMFFGADRIDYVRKMILADNTQDRQEALEKLLPMQKEDFISLFKVMEGLPVTIRLLDPPLHEFIPHNDEELKELSSRLEIPLETLKTRVRSLQESNPMLGHRGCRLAISYPEIYLMQVKAIAEAAASVIKEGKKAIPEIMIPLVAIDKELKTLRDLTVSEVDRVMKEQKVEFDYQVGTMIELPRAALTAFEVAEHADFFSFGTNDLTQSAMGLSRDDASKFLGTYVEEGLLPKDPFVTIDQEGVGKLVEIGTNLGRNRKQDLKCGVCGEHGGEPESVAFFHRVGLDYVSCSPFRVPIACLAAARATLAE